MANVSSFSGDLLRPLTTHWFCQDRCYADVAPRVCPYSMVSEIRQFGACSENSFALDAVAHNSSSTSSTLRIVGIAFGAASIVLGLIVMCCRYCAVQDARRRAAQQNTIAAASANNGLYPGTPNVGYIANESGQPGTATHTIQMPSIHQPTGGAPYPLGMVPPPQGGVVTTAAPLAANYATDYGQHYTTAYTVPLPDSKNDMPPPYGQCVK